MSDKRCETWPCYALNAASALIQKAWELAPYVLGLHGVINKDALTVAVAAFWLAVRAQPKDTPHE